MMNTADELEDNPFFRYLKTKHSKICQHASKNLYVICVPAKGTFQPDQLSQKAIESHIFKPSPYFLGEFCSLDNRTIRIERNQIFLKEGYTKLGQVITILGEELFYNEDYQSYKVYCIEKPLEALVYTGDPVFQYPFPKERTVEGDTKYLLSLNKAKRVLEKVDKLTYEFNNSYILVRGFLDDALNKIRKIHQIGFDVFFFFSSKS